eukprot:716310-Prymnesium_polylepis.1
MLWVCARAGHRLLQEVRAPEAAGDGRGGGGAARGQAGTVGLRTARDHGSLCRALGLWSLPVSLFM